MALDLKQECKCRLIEAIAEGLPLCRVQNGKFLDYLLCQLALSKAERVIPERGQLRERLEEYVGHFPVMEFVLDLISIELSERGEYLSDSPWIELTKLEGYEDPEATANYLVNQMESLPWKYTLSILLPARIGGFFNRLFDEFPLSDSIRLVTSKANLEKQFSLTCEDDKRHKRIHGEPGLLASIVNPEPEWSDESAYVQINAEGFIGRYGTTAPATEAKETLRSICGLAIATHLFKVEHSFFPFPIKSHFYVHKHTDDDCNIDGKFELEERYTYALNNLVFENFDGKLKEDEHLREWVEARLQDMRVVLSVGEKADKILRASRWLFDSYAVKDELLSYVQTMVVLEILLGEDESSGEIGLGQLLRNRCAYLIAKTHEQRASLLRDFKRIYDVRSRIVHRGHSRLTPNERRLFNTLRWMCLRVIQEEVRLLRADAKAS